MKDWETLQDFFSLIDMHIAEMSINFDGGLFRAKISLEGIRTDYGSIINMTNHLKECAKLWNFCKEQRPDILTIFKIEEGEKK